MTRDGAERAVTISALVVIAIYFYRHLTEGTSSTPTSSKCPAPKNKDGKVGKLAQLAGFGTPANVGQFITAWGFVYFVLSIVASAAPGLGGGFAILVAVTDVLGNSCQVAHDVTTKVSPPTPAQTLSQNVPAGASPGAFL